MSRIIGMPQIEIDFRYAGATAAIRGEKGQLILIVKEEKEGNKVTKLRMTTDFNTDIKKTFSDDNIRYITEALAESPRELVVIRWNEGASGFEDEEGVAFDPITTIDEALKLVNTVANRNCWVTIASQAKSDTEELINFIKSENKFNKKRYKALVYQADKPNNPHIVNFTTDSFIRVDGEEYESGVELIPRMAAALAAQPFNTSIIAKPFNGIEYVTQPEDMDKAVDEGEFFLFNDEGAIKVGRGVNSLTDLEDNMTEEMKFIIIVEQMDLIYSDIYTTWNAGYKGRYKNNLDNQMLLVSALKAYLTGLEQDQILDISFDNDVEIDTDAQRLANIPIYGSEEVGGWNDNQVMERTVGTNVYLRLKVKMLNTMEDVFMTIML